MIVQAQAEAPNECCGVLAGQLMDDVFVVVQCFPLINAADDPTRRFESSPESMFAAVKAIRAMNLDIVAVYHSHPQGGDRLSATDREWNYAPTVANIIIDLSQLPPHVTGWWIDGHETHPCAIDLG